MKNSKSANGVNSPHSPDVLAAIHAAIELPDLSRTEKLVLVGIICHGLYGSEPGNRRLMRYASSRKEETVSKALGVLRRRGLIAQRDRSGRSNVLYTSPDMIKPEAAQ